MTSNKTHVQATLAADSVIFRNNRSEVLLVKRDKEPFKNMWVFPGGHVDTDETIIEAAYRELEEETNVTNIELQHIDIADRIYRDPRGRYIAIVYYGDLLESNTSIIKGGDDAIEAQWFQLSKLPDMGFDHKEILERIIKKITIS